ncbi:MAG: hypothetical protein IT376_11580 [Polyangiaceae bacterium]|nr:hypothetical protein [Polyangiaceae bacterium]
MHQITVQHAALAIVQRKELAELVGFESRNKYAIETTDGQPLWFAAEQGKGLLSTVFRQLLGHWRTFEIHVFDTARQLVLRAIHPFTLFFQRLEVYSADGRPLGRLQQRFSILSKRFDVQDARGATVLSVRSPLWKPWTFSFQRDGRELAVVKKQWGGAVRELLTDADRFRVDFLAPELGPDERALLVCAGIFIDLQYFEKQA